jgi:hypothetical protein
MLLWWKPQIYSGTFGRGLFQTLYQPPASLFHYLPLTFEWTALSLPLALGGIGVEIARGGWWWLLTLPLVLTWAMCVKGGLSAKIAPGFEGPKARGLIALLIYLGPLLRGWSRLKWRLKLLPVASPAPGGPIDQRGRWSWQARGFVLSYWNETGTEKEAMLGALMRVCAAEHRSVAMDAGWEDWDLEISGRPAGGARILVAGENHGADKRLLRVRTTLRLSRPARVAIGGLATLSLISLVCGGTTAAAGFAALAVAAGGAALSQLLLFARRLHRMIEVAAQQSALVPVQPLARVMPVGPPRTA